MTTDIGTRGSVSLILTPLELIERLAALISPPRRQAAAPQEAAIRLSGPRMALVGRRRPARFGRADARTASTGDGPFSDSKQLSFSRCPTVAFGRLCQAGDYGK